MARNKLKLFEDLVGARLPFFGVASNEFKLGDCVWEAVEDPDDGYRSYLDCIQETDSSGPFFKQPLAEVVVSEVRDDNYFYGFLLTDAQDGHIWLRIGTDYDDESYPCFIFNYEPKHLVE